MLRRIRDVAGSVLALVVLLAVLVSIDPRARTRMMRVVSDVTQTSWSGTPSAVGGAVVDVARDLTLQNVFLVSLVGAAVVLVFLMLRT